jgi:hypothetical protein
MVPQRKTTEPGKELPLAAKILAFLGVAGVLTSAFYLLLDVLGG